ncbi:hypothetical protein D3C75_778620 [compost metagenome]
MLGKYYRMREFTADRAGIIIKSHICTMTDCGHKGTQLRSGDHKIPVGEEQHLSLCRLRTDTAAHIMSERLLEVDDMCPL